MLVRLLDYDREPLSTVQAPLARIPLRAFRHAGMLYERVSDGVDGMPEYRATERVLTRSHSITIVDAHGSDLATLIIPGDTLPPTVTHDGCVCPLWTSRDQGGRALYLWADHGD